MLWLNVSLALSRTMFACVAHPPSLLLITLLCTPVGKSTDTSMTPGISFGNVKLNTNIKITLRIVTSLSNIWPITWWIASMFLLLVGISVWFGHVLSSTTQLKCLSVLVFSLLWWCLILRWLILALSWYFYSGNRSLFSRMKRYVLFPASLLRFEVALLVFQNILIMWWLFRFYLMIPNRLFIILLFVLHLIPTFLSSIGLWSPWQSSSNCSSWTFTQERK